MDEISQISNKQSNIFFYFMLSISMIGSFVILFQNIFRWTIVDLFTPFLAPIIEMIGYIIFGFCSVIVFVYFVVSARLRRARNGVPVLLNIIAFILVMVVPFTSITLNLDYQFHKSEREEVVQMVLDGSLTPNVSHNNSLIRLPGKYKKLSKGGGEIVIERIGSQTQVLFFTYRGVLDNYAGFIYSTDGGKPEEEVFGKFIEVKEMSKRWYWVSAT